jgi:L-rhamnonate dehydratase
LPKIVEVNCHVAPMAGSWLSESVIANPMSGYPEYWERRSSWFGEMTAAAIEIVIDDGKGRVAATILDAHFRSLLIGQDILRIPWIPNILRKASLAYGRGGIVEELISGIDIALWDLRGKLYGWPYWRAFGDSARSTLPVYYTGNDPTALAEFGIRDMKIAVPYGPAHGDGSPGTRYPRARCLLGLGHLHGLGR